MCCFPFRCLLFQLSKAHQSLATTKQLHALIIKTHLSSDPFYATKTIRFYALNNHLHYARTLFDTTPSTTVYLWNSIIRAYAQLHRFSDAFSLFEQMRTCTDSKPDHYTFACILRAFMEKSDPFGLRIVHAGLVVMGLGSNSVSSSALVNAYSKLGFIDEARKVFDGIFEHDLVMWNSMIAAYGHGGYGDKCLELFCMMRRTGREPDGYTMVGLVSGQLHSSLLAVGQGIHSFCLKSGFDSNLHVKSSLVSMYSRCNSLDSAYRVFSSLSRPDLVLWSALITGFSQCGYCEKAMVLFKDMHVKGIKADQILIAGVLAACGRLVTVGLGREIHAYVFRSGYESDILVASALIDMYSKCGFAAGLGVRVFETLQEKNVVVYNTAISGLASHGFAFEAFEIFEKMLEEGFKPDGSTFSALLCACCHAALVKDGKNVFKRMVEEFGVEARNEHYVHMVKLLGMTGELEEAYSLIQNMSTMDAGVLGALLSCCAAHGNSELGELVARQLSELDPEKTAYKVMLSNIYAMHGKWDDAKKLRDNMLDEGLQKTPGNSSPPSTRSRITLSSITVHVGKYVESIPVSSSVYNPHLFMAS